MAEKTLSDAQRRMLEVAERSGGVFSGRGRSRATEDRLRLAGLLSFDRDELGYYRITPAGRAALSRSMGETRWPKQGDLMRFLGRNGYPFQLDKAKTVFAVDGIYTVKDCHVGNWEHSVSFEQFAGRWNGVMFDFADEVSP